MDWSAIGNRDHARGLVPVPTRRVTAELCSREASAGETKPPGARLAHAVQRALPVASRPP
jgi:hypothetical protein